MSKPDHQPNPSGQLELGLGGTAGPDVRDGLEEWRSKHREQLEKLARESGLPVGFHVSVTLRSGTGLFGLLEIDWRVKGRVAGNRLPLKIGPTTFMADEIASCVRED